MTRGVVYIDSSVLLRVVLGQRDSLREWTSIRQGVTSALAEVECLRALDRLRVTCDLTDTELAVRREAIYRILETMEIAAVNAAVLSRASGPFPTTLGTLDAIHLATALLCNAGAKSTPLTLATHDTELAIAAQACGLLTIGT